jgi:hypothetical protein
MAGEIVGNPGEAPIEGGAEAGGPAEAIAAGLTAMLEAAPTPELQERIQKVMAELGDIATMMEGGELPQQAATPGQSQVGAPQQGSPVV